MTTGWPVLGLLDGVPPALWTGIVAVNLVVLLATWRLAGRRMRRAGQRLADPQLVTGRAKTRDSALTLAAMVPAVLFWAVVLAGSFRGLTAFGRDTLRWEDGWEYLVPGSLDGVAVAFAFLAFRAVRKQKAPDRCYRVVWGAAIASAVVNFNYEYEASGQNLVAGGYLALLSLFGMVMFHEFLHQFEEGTTYVKRESPKFGLRWLTWPTNTLCAAVAWRNHPPARGTSATVRNAVANLERVRELKRETREATAAARHERAISRARRRSSLDSAKRRARHRELAPAPVSTNGQHRPPDTAAVAPPQPPLRPASEAGRSRARPKVPGAAWRVNQWIDTWMKMCGDGDLVLGPITDDQYARSTYAASARHLDNVRRAAVSGALRDRAGELGVSLPSGYTDDPAALRLGAR